MSRSQTKNRMHPCPHHPPRPEKHPGPCSSSLLRSPSTSASSTTPVSMVGFCPRGLGGCGRQGWGAEEARNARGSCASSDITAREGGEVGIGHLIGSRRPRKESDHHVAESEQKPKPHTPVPCAATRRAPKSILGLARPPSCEAPHPPPPHLPLLPPWWGSVPAGLTDADVKGGERKKPEMRGAAAGQLRVVGYHCARGRRSRNWSLDKEQATEERNILGLACPPSCERWPLLFFRLCHRRSVPPAGLSGAVTDKGGERKKRGAPRNARTSSNITAQEGGEVEIGHSILIGSRRPRKTPLGPDTEHTPASSDYLLRSWRKNQNPMHPYLAEPRHPGPCSSATRWPLLLFHLIYHRCLHGVLSPRAVTDKLKDVKMEEEKKRVRPPKCARVVVVVEYHCTAQEGGEVEIGTAGAGLVAFDARWPDSRPGGDSVDAGAFGAQDNGNKAEVDGAAAAGLEESSPCSRSFAPRFLRDLRLRAIQIQVRGCGCGCGCGERKWEWEGTGCGEWRCVGGAGQGAGVACGGGTGDVHTDMIRGRV
ncbi:hypothetical protein K438DRAFT_2118216 [Mycena galopus ATCC 62051]|nr:hypothetical protein K438DRAFT_2118216 [Mycena galopus ATCC 62051]